MKQVFTYILIFWSLQFSIAQTANFQNASLISGINNPGENYGVAVIDYDNDGDDDIYITRQYGEPNILYQNDGNANFVNVAGELGLADEGDGMMSIWGDIDNDDDLDLYIGNRNGNDVLLRNDNDTFIDITFFAGIYNIEQPRSLNFADIDNDGDLDLYVANILAENKMYLNVGDNIFLNATSTSGTTDQQISMGAIFFDYDNDNDQDLYLTHDADQAFILYQNDGTGTYENVSEASNANIEAQGMGVDVADINLDGYLDIYVTNFYSNSLLLNKGDGTFEDISSSAGITDVGMGWGVMFLDYDNDGYPDIYINNQSNVNPMENNKLYRNLGDNTFAIVSTNTIIASPYAGIGAASADFNNDGKIDIFICNQDTNGNQLFLNQNSNGNNWIQIKTVGTISNKNGIGARITIHSDGKVYTDEINAGSSYASQNSLVHHFGLGVVEEIELITVKWPSGIIDSLINILPNQKIIIIEGEEQTPTTSNYDLQDLEVDFNFQNPSKKNIEIKYKVKSLNDLKIRLIDNIGKVIFQQNIEEYDGVVNWEILDPGIYYIQFNQEGKIKSKKIIIQ